MFASGNCMVTPPGIQAEPIALQFNPVTLPSVSRRKRNLVKSDLCRFRNQWKTLISVDLAKKLAKYIPWEPKVGDLTIVFGEAGEEIIEPINLKHEKEKKILLSLRNVGHIVWLPRLTMLLYELKKRSEKGFSLTYDRETDSWCYRDERMEICNSSPEDAAARALLRLLEEEEEKVS